MPHPDTPGIIPEKAHLSRRHLILGALAAVVGISLAVDQAEARGRGWGPDGFGPPGQRKKGMRGRKMGKVRGRGKAKGRGW